MRDLKMGLGEGVDLLFPSLLSSQSMAINLGQQKENCKGEYLD